MRYRWQTGATAWLLHRVTGAAVGIYLLLHIMGQFDLKYGEAWRGCGFPQRQGDRGGPPGLFNYHTLNGVRELIVDFGRGALYHKKLFWVMMAIGLALFIAGLIAL